MRDDFATLVADERMFYVSVAQQGPETYISVDIETNGRIPGLHSMLSIGAAAFSEEGILLDTFSINLEPLPFAVEHKETMDWWKTKPEAWAECQKNQEDPEVAMRRFSEWVKSLPNTPVCAAYPAAWDFMFIYWYLIYFLGESPCGFSALDMKTYAMPITGGRYFDGKSAMPVDWLEGGRENPHIAVEDAIRQGRMFMKMREAARRLLFWKPAGVS